jgi:hypothetical protein
MSGLDWKSSGTMVATCPLRTCALPLQRYRSFFDRLLKL